MSDHSAIQWTDATWNPTTGCTKISPGCAHCYIERTPAFRIAGNTFEHGKTDLTIFHDRLEQPLHWRKPRRVFVNSLSDLFHEDISDAFIVEVLGVMRAAYWHTFQVLTKRAERMQDVVNRIYDLDGGFSLLKNVWLGVSVENQRFADERIPLLLATPAAVRFISAEPLLEDVDLTPHLWGDTLAAPGPSGFRRGPRLDWVIVGGESGPGARAFDLTWGRSIIAQCREAEVACFVKQLGAHAFEGEPENGGGGPLYGLRDKKGGDIDEWPDDLRVREFPNLPRGTSQTSLSQT
jgi:protein gp37